MEKNGSELDSVNGCIVLNEAANKERREAQTIEEIGCALSE